MRQLRKRVVLVHSDNCEEPKEFFDRCDYWTNVNNLLWCQDMLSCTDIRSRTFRSIVEVKTRGFGKQFTNGTNPTVQGGRIVYTANSFCKVRKWLISAGYLLEI